MPLQLRPGLFSPIGQKCEPNWFPTRLTNASRTRISGTPLWSLTPDVPEKVRSLIDWLEDRSQKDSPDLIAAARHWLWILSATRRQMEGVV